MSRDTKFRGKALDHDGLWVYGDYITAQGRYGPIPQIFTSSYDLEEASHRTRIDYATVGQFTGMKDQNDVEIYEGDICIVHITEANPHPPNVIGWSKRYCCFTIGSLSIERMIDSGYYQAGPHRCDFEIIGNKHDNPELLHNSEAD